MNDIVDGYYQDKNFIEIESLPIVNIGDKVSFKYGKKDKKHEVTGVHHYFYLNDEDNKVHHWMSVSVRTKKGNSKLIQGNWVIKENIQ
jgi:hypothetical protein